MKVGLIASLGRPGGGGARGEQAEVDCCQC